MRRRRWLAALAGFVASLASPALAGPRLINQLPTQSLVGRMAYFAVQTPGDPTERQAPFVAAVENVIRSYTSSQATVGGTGYGDVTGPDSSTNGDVACFDGTTGKLLKDCGSFSSLANSWLSGKTTTDLAEGSNLYYTNARADARIANAVGVSVQAYDADLSSWAGVTRASGFDTFTATPSSANLRALLTDESGTGAALFANGDIGAASGTSLTLSSLTAGRVLFAGTSGIIDDDATFVWDDTNKRLGLGVTPSTPIDAYASPANFTDSVGHTTHSASYRFYAPSTLTGAASNEAVFGEVLLDHASNQNVLAVTTGIEGRASVARTNANGVATMQGGRFLAIPQGTGGVALARGATSLVYSDATSSVVAATGHDFLLSFLSNATVTTGTGWRVLTPNGRVSGSPNTTWTQIYGGLIQDQKPSGASSTLTNPPIALGIDAQTATGAYSIKSLGGLNVLAGNLRVGSTSDPTAALDVTGAAKVSSTLSAAGITDSTRTSGRVAFYGTGGVLSDDSDLTFATDTLTATKVSTSLGIGLAATSELGFNGIGGGWRIRQTAGAALVMKDAGGTDRTTLTTAAFSPSASASITLGTSSLPWGDFYIGGGSSTGFVDLTEYNTTSDAAAPSDNHARLYVRDNGSGKEQVIVRFNTGAVVPLATEP